MYDFLNFLGFQLTEEGICAVYEVAVPANTKKTSKLAWQCLQIQFNYFRHEIYISVNWQKTTCLQ